MASVAYNQGVPEVQPQAAVTPRQQLATSPDTFGASVGRGVEQLGQGAQKQGEFWGEVQTDSALNDAFAKSSDVVEQYRTLRGEDALNQRAEIEQRIDGIFKESGQSLASPQQQQRFQAQARAYRDRYIRGMINSHADQEGRAFTTAQNSATHALGMKMIATDPNNDVAFGQGLSMAAKGATRNLQALGLAGDQEIVRNTMNEVAIDGTESRIKALIASPNLADRKRAKDIFDTNRQLLSASKNYDAFSDYIENHFNELKATEDAEQYLSKSTPGGVGTAVGPAPNNLGNVKTVAAARAGTQEFEQPATPVDGVILAANNLRSGYAGLTLSQIAEKWAPKDGGNDPAAWARNVASASGIQVGAVPDLNNPDTLRRLVGGIAVAEKSPSQRVMFSDAVLREGVDSAIAGRSPKLNKAAMLADEAQTLAAIDRDYADDPRMGHKVSAIVRGRFAEARMASQAQQLAATDAKEKSLREAGDLIRKDPAFNIHGWLDQHPDLPEQAAEHLITISEQAMDARLHGKPGDYGPKAPDVLQRILDPKHKDADGNPDGIIHQEQLNAIAAAHALNPTGWQWASQMLDLANKEGAGGDREMLSTFYRDARTAVTMYDGTHDLLPGAVEKWDKALPILTQSLTEGRAKGIPLGQMLARDGGKDSVWKALGEAGGPFLPSTAQIVAGQINRDAAAAAKTFDVDKVTKLEDLQKAYTDRLVSIDQARAAVLRHPEWGIKFRDGDKGPMVPLAEVKKREISPAEEPQWDAGFVHHLNAASGTPKFNSLGYALQYFAGSDDDPERKKLATALAEKVNQAGDDKFRFIPQANVRDGVGGVTTKQDGKIVVGLHPDAVNGETALHESVHAVLWQYMDHFSQMHRTPDRQMAPLPDSWTAPEKAGAQAVYDVFERMSKIPYDGRQPIWLTEARSNPDEFLARAMTDKDFQGWMRKHPGGGERSMWDRFVDGAKKLILGGTHGDAKERTLLEDSLEAGYGLIGTLK